MYTVVCVIIAMSTLAGFNWKAELGVVLGRSTADEVRSHCAKRGFAVVRDTVVGGEWDIVVSGLKFLGSVADSVVFSGGEKLASIDVYYSVARSGAGSTTGYLLKRGAKTTDNGDGTVLLKIGGDCFLAEYDEDLDVLHYFIVRL